MTLKYLGFILILGLVSSCHKSAGLYIPSFEGIQTVSQKGQWVHSTNMGAFVGKYANYSPLKNVGIFADARFNVFKPQVSGAIGLYKGKYKQVEVTNRSKQKDIRMVGAHIDSYIGFGYQNNIENYKLDSPNIPTSSSSNNNIEYKNFRSFVQVAGHWKSPKMMMNLLYRYNRIDVEQIIYYPSDPDVISHVQRIADNNPFSIHEIQAMVSVGNDRLHTTLSTNIALPIATNNVTNYSNFNHVQIGLSYILDTFDKK